MKKILCVCALAQFLFMAGITTPKSMAQSSLEGFYVSGKIFASQQGHWAEPSLSMDTGGKLAKSYSFYDTALGLAIAAGYDFYPRFDVPIRMDLEYALRTTVQGQGSYDLTPFEINESLELNSYINVQTLMLNLYYDFYNSTRFTPYVTAGVGMAFVDSSFFLSSDADFLSAGHSIDIGLGKSKSLTNFAWQVGAGVSVALSPHASLDLGYRFLSLGNMDYDVASLSNAGLGGTVQLQTKGLGVAHEVGLGLRYTFGGEDGMEAETGATSTNIAQKSPADEPSVGIYVSAKALAGAQTHWPTTSAIGGTDIFVASGDWTKMTMGAALALGYDFYPRFDVPVRLEVEYAMRSEWRGEKNFEFQGVDVSYEPSVHVQTLMLNVAYDFHNSTRFTPYITAGIGAAFLDAQLQLDVSGAALGGGGGALPIGYDASLASLAWQVGAGLEVELTPSMSLDFGYKFLSLGHFDYELTDGIPSSSTFVEIFNVENSGSIHEVSVGLRYTF